MILQPRSNIWLSEVLLPTSQISWCKESSVRLTGWQNLHLPLQPSHLLFHCLCLLALHQKSSRNSSIYLPALHLQPHSPHTRRHYSPPIPRTSTHCLCPSLINQCFYSHPRPISIFLFPEHRISICKTLKPDIRYNENSCVWKRREAFYFLLRVVFADLDVVEKCVCGIAAQ